MTPMFEGRSPKKEAPKPRPVRLRDKRRRMRIFVACICLLSTLGAIGGLGAATHVERLTINDVSVSGAQAVAPEALVASVNAGLSTETFKLFSRENIFLYPKGAIEDALARDFPRIKDVALSRPSLLAQAVVVAVEERTPYAKWCVSACYLMDSGGFVFAESTGEATTIGYEFRGGLAKDRSPVGQWFLRGRLPEAVAFLDKLGVAGFKAVAFDVGTDKDFSVMLEGGTMLYLPFGSDTDALLRNLVTTVETDSLRDRIGELQYIDLRFGNRVYYR